MCKLSFLNELKKRIINRRKFYGVEQNKFILKKFKKNKFFELNDNIEKFDITFDIITMFHVLHYLPNQVSTLKKIQRKLKKKWKNFHRSS